LLLSNRKKPSSSGIDYGNIGNSDLSDDQYKYDFDDDDDIIGIGTGGRKNQL
jgi:hypothetical protein